MVVHNGLHGRFTKGKTEGNAILLMRKSRQEGRSNTNGIIYLHNFQTHKQVIKQKLILKSVIWKSEYSFPKDYC